MKIKPWRKIGPPRILSSGHGKSFGNQNFINPKNGVLEEFSFFSGGKTVPVIVLPITTDKKLVVTRQFRHTANRIFIELPGGHKHPNESPITTARRELLEETGFKAGKIIRLKTKKVWFEPGVFNTAYVPYVAIGCHKISEPFLDSTECIETITIPIDEWLDMIFKGLITDNKTLAITLLALPYIGIKLKK